MKKNALLMLITLILISCSEDNNSFPKVENVVKGKKWTIEIGSSHQTVYEQLQRLNNEKSINNVSLIYRQPYNSPNDIDSDISLYKSITLESSFGNTDKVLIQFNQNKVSSIEKGNSLLNPIQKFPENLPNNNNSISIKIGDPVNKILQKLKGIYEIESYKKYKIIFPDKSLVKPYDPIMKKYNEWGFVFSNNISSSLEGRNTVRLYFENEKLVKIRNEYEELNKIN